MRGLPQPFYREQRKRWAVQIGGKQINLGPDKDRAFETYRKLIGSDGQSQSQTPGPASHAVASRNLLELFERFLDWVEKNKRAPTLRWYRDHLSAFAKTIPPTMTVAELRPHHVQLWADGPGVRSFGGRKTIQIDVTATTKRNRIRSVKTALEWAIDQGYIDQSPIARMKVPLAERRETYVTEADYKLIRDVTRDEEFRDLVDLAWHTGARPQELRKLEARHVELTKAIALFPIKESKGKKRNRVILLNDAAMSIVRRLVANYPEGPILRNTDGKGWSNYAVNCRFTTIKRKTGRRFCLYMFRHGMATRIAVTGGDVVAGAAILGHDPKTFASVYAHVAGATDHLRNVLNQATAVGA